MKHTDGKAVDIQFDKNDQAQAKEDAVGTYVLRTNRLDLGGEEISKLHRSLTTVEESFENMKGDLGLRPNFHHTDILAIAHVHVTVLAYHMLAGILKKLRTAWIHYNWNTIRDILATHIRVTTTMNTEDDHVIDVRTCTTPTEKQHKGRNIHYEVAEKSQAINCGGIGVIHQMVQRCACLEVWNT